MLADETWCAYDEKCGLDFKKKKDFVQLIYLVVLWLNSFEDD